MTPNDQPTPTAEAAPRLSAERMNAIRSRASTFIGMTRRQSWSDESLALLLAELDDLRASLAVASARAEAAERQSGAYRETLAKHLDRLMELEAMDKEHFDCPTHIRVLIEHRDKVIRDLAQERAANERLREALANSTRELQGWHAERPCSDVMKSMCVSCGYIKDGLEALAQQHAPATADGSGED